MATMSLDEEFTQVADEVKKLKKTPSDDELLILYGLFKQATVGDNETARPGMFDLKGKAKWDAWTARKGMSKEEAKAEYVKYAQGLIKQYNA